MKKMLFIAPNDFLYYEKIVDEIKKNEISVDYYDEKPDISYNKFWKIIKYIFKKIYFKRVNSYFYNIIEKNIEYDIIFIIRGMYLNVDILEKMKSKNKNAKFILYQWDSLNSLPNLEECLIFFDKLYSFDKRDCENIKDFIFKPLFYTDDYKYIENSDEFKIKYKYSFIGTYHSDRYELLEKLKKELNITSEESFFFLYRKKASYFFQKYVLRNDKGRARLKDLNCHPLTISEVAKYIKSSKIIIDSQHPQQTGVTMRTIEALGAKKKIITTNKNLIDYDFYNPENIFIIDRNKVNTIPDDFAEGNYLDLPKEIYEKYYLKNWIKGFEF